VVWLYTGKLDLDERQRVEWAEVATRLGIVMGEIGALRDDQNISKKIKDVFVKEDEKVVAEKQFGKTAMDDSVLNSFKSLSVNDSLSRHTRRQFCDVDIFTSDDESFVVGGGDNIDIDVDIISNNNIAVDSIKPVSSGVQCDLSFEEEDAEFIEDIGENIEDTSDQLENSSHGDAIVNISNCLNDHDAKPLEDEDVKNQTANVFIEEKHHDANVLNYENYHDGNISKDVKNQDGNVSNDVKCDDANISNVLTYHDATTGVNCNNLNILTDENVMNSSEKCDVNQISDVSDGASDAGNNEVETDKNETVYQDCEEEFENRIDEPFQKATDANDETVTDPEDTFTDNESEQSERSYESDPSSGNGSEEDSESDDPSWRASSNDASDHSDEEGNTAKKDLVDVGDALPMSDISNVNISSLHTRGLGVCPTPLVTMSMCQCKGSCVRSCVCRSGGQRCSRRCSCQPSKCRWREETEESKENESEGAGFQESNLLGTSYLSPQITGAVTSQTCDNGNTTVDYREASFLPPPTVNTAVYSPSTVLCTPSCQPIPMSASTSLLSTTARKRNRKKLFTETVGPQEL